MRTADQHLIRGFPLFRGVQDDVFDRVTASAQIRDWQPGETVLVEGEKPAWLFVLLNGLVEAFSGHGGKETTLSFVRPPGAFIMAAVWTDQVQLTSIRTIEKSRILQIPAEDIRSGLAQDASFAKAAGLELAIRYRDILRELKNQRMRSATERLANWLLLEQEISKTPSFSLPIPKSLLAARLGMTNEHLSRSLNILRDHGVSLSGSVITLDRQALISYAHPSILMDGADI